MAEGIVTDWIEAIRKAPTLEALYQEVDRLSIRPGWLAHDQAPAGPKTQSVYLPAHWRFDLCKAALEAAGRLIDVDLAERRNLVLRNPIPGNVSTTRTLVSAYQSILPGEKAPSHRHVSHALRVIIDAKGAYSTVDGEKTPMETGDVVLTPGWSWHEHGHDGDEPAYWLDALDAPLTRVLETAFFEDNPDRFARDVRSVATSPYRFTRNDIARRLDKAKPDPEGFHGPRTVLEAPTMPTMQLTMERLSSGTAPRRQRSTTNRIFCCVEGSGESILGDKTFAWRRGDAFVAPCWTRFQHRATTDAILFSVSDEPLMRGARHYRFEAD